MLNPRLNLLVDYPFQRLTALLGGPATESTINMTIGEPQHQPPPFVAAILAEQSAGWGRYPPFQGTTALRQAIAGWLTRRFALTPVPGSPWAIDPDRQVLPLAGTRGGLFEVALLADSTIRDGRPPVILLPNPFYQVYAGAGLIAGAELHFVAASAESGFLPDFAAVPRDILDRTVLAYLCNPANPQGAVASPAYLTDAITLARRHHFILAVDECYSEIYGAAVPGGALAACQSLGDDFGQVLVFNSLSKRSSAPGLRSGFVAGDAALIAAFGRLSAYGGGAIPLPIMAASAALWNDEAHVAASRALYRENFDVADSILGDLPGYRRPAGGFFLWLRVSDGEQAALALWQRGIRVLPGAYLGRADAAGHNPGQAYLRIALVHDRAVTAAALARLATVLRDDRLLAS